MTRKVLVAWIAGCLALAALLNACQETGQASATGGKVAGHWLTPELAMEEYALVAKKLSLRPGTSWPTTPIVATRNGDEPVLYEVGFGKQEAQFHWYCSWASGAVDAQLARPRQREALAMALRIRDTYFFQSALNKRGRRFLGEVLASAEAGNLKPLRRDVRLNCASS